MCIFNEPSGGLLPSGGVGTLLEPPSHPDAGKSWGPRRDAVPGCPPASETLTGWSWDAAYGRGEAGSPDCRALMVDARPQ